MSLQPAAHGPLACVTLAAAALAVAPISVSWIVALKLRALIGVLLRLLIGRGRRKRTGTQTASEGVNGKTKHSQRRRTALVNGGRMQKAVYVVRALAKRGYRVILVEERGWGELCATRFSNAVDRFYLIPSCSEDKAYSDAIIKIARSEGVDLFVPCSGVSSTVVDAEIAAQLRKKFPKMTTVIQDADLAETLHEKDRFIDLVHELHLDAPASYIIKTPDEAMDLFRKHTDESSPMIMKSAVIVDDVGRNDMTTYPFRDAKSGKPDWDATRRRLTSGLSVPLKPTSPFIAQEFIGGSGASEWCTHATVIDGQVVAFVCCPSNDMLLTYHNATQTFIGDMALQWTQTFLARLKTHDKWKNTRLTGSFSMDFIHQPSKDRLVVIECNPRIHTAICLLDEQAEVQEAFGAALAGENLDKIVTPGLDAEPVSWIGHDIIARQMPFYLPRSLARWLFGKRVIDTPADVLRAGATQKHQQALLTYDLEARGRDGAWHNDDPAVYAAFYHLQWPALLLRQGFIRRVPFSRINASTARIFEC